MRRGDQILIGEVRALVAGVDLRKVEGMVAVVVITGGVLDDRSNPYRGEAQRLDVVELVGKTFEVAAPRGVGIGVVRLLIIPAVNVVAGIAVIETGGDDEVDGVLAHINAGVVICFIRILLAETAVSVPPLARGTGQLVRDLAVLGGGGAVGQQEVDLRSVTESIGVPSRTGLGHIALHRNTGIGCLFVGGQCVPVVDVGNLVGAFHMDDDAVRAGLGDLGIGSNIGDIFIGSLCGDNGNREDHRKAHQKRQNTRHFFHVLLPPYFSTGNLSMIPVLYLWIRVASMILTSPLPSTSALRSLIGLLIGMSAS